MCNDSPRPIMKTPTVSTSSIAPSFSLPNDRWPGSLAVSGKTLDDFVSIGDEAHPDASWTVRVFHSVSEPTLQIRAQWRAIGAVTEWIPTLVNNSPKPSVRITEVRSLAASWPTRGPVDFYGTNGSDSTPNDYVDRTELDIGVVELMPKGGRSSDGIFPFFALTDRHDSLAIGIGWSGRWCATLRHTNGLLQIEVGLPQVGFVLQPQESVRLPSVLLARAPGKTADQARRVARAHMTKHVVPRAADGGSTGFTAYSMMYDFLHGNPVISEEGEIAALEQAAALGFETYWVDAGWYGTQPNWVEEVGSWYVRRSDLPRGLRPISDRAHERGMKFIFWMEPERARQSSEWARAHPELFLSYPGHNAQHDWWKKDNVLLNLGDPRAVDLAFAKISSLITEFNADIFRQDFNTTPLDAWYAADAPDRVGITEIRYVEGLYELWDRLLAAHPGLVIDNCASGGRRIDLETMRRSVPLWRSDYLMDKGGAELNIASQLQCWGLGHWIPDHLGIIKRFDAYATRSALSTALMAYRALPGEQDPEYANAIAAIAENKRLRPFIGEERIGLIAPSLGKEVWMALQYHRHSDSSGIIVALRGPDADSETVTLFPEHIDANATYQVTRWDDYRVAAPAQVAGAKLKETVITIAQTRSSILIEYQRVG